MTGDQAFRRLGGSTLGVSVLERDRHEGRDSSAKYFADEIAIDFPSVASAVERIRRGLVHDDHAQPLPAVLTLSKVKARTGVVTPLSVPVRATCRSCGGRGESWTENCACCYGTGAEMRTHTVQITVPRGVADGATFWFSVTPRSQPSTRIALRILVD